jgi:hypothetical protein
MKLVELWRDYQLALAEHGDTEYTHALLFDLLTAIASHCYSLRSWSSYLSGCMSGRGLTQLAAQVDCTLVSWSAPSLRTDPVRIDWHRNWHRTRRDEQ